MPSRWCDEHVWTIITWRGDDGRVLGKERICFRCARRGSLPADQDAKDDR